MLGVLTTPINFPRHFLLRWTKNEGNHYYIDAFHKGNRRSAQEVLASTESNPDDYDNAEPIEVFQRMVRFWSIL